MNLNELISLSYICENTEDYKDLEKYISKLNSESNSLKYLIIMDDKIDNSNSFLEINAGSGGLDSHDCVKLMINMYISWMSKCKLNYKISHIAKDDLGGVKHISMKVNGKNSYGLLKNEKGIHKIIRYSPFNNKRHTSFISVDIYPESNEKIIRIDKKDLKIDTYKSSGAGGQHVNTTDSAVRVKHIETGIVIQCQSERSQHKNKILAIKQLESKLRLIGSKKKRHVKTQITWGNSIRSYIFDKHIVKDLKHNCTFNLTKIINGDLEEFLFNK